MVFERMRVKYCSWWKRRIDTPEKLEAERRAWRAVVCGMSIVVLRDGLLVMRKHFAYHPPTAQEFADLVRKLEARPINQFTGKPIDPVVKTHAADLFFQTARQLLK